MASQGAYALSARCWPFAEPERASTKQSATGEEAELGRGGALQDRFFGEEARFASARYSRERGETVSRLPRFAKLHGREPTVLARAPAAIDLMGEHTDYNGGFVLATASPQQVVVELAPNGGGDVHAFSAEAVGPPETYSLGSEKPGRGWLDRVQGVTEILRKEGCAIGGFDLLVTSQIPRHVGLSHGAALEVALLRALREVFGLALDDVRVAQAGGRAETEFVGSSKGIMDLLASSLADPRSALFVDVRTLAHERLPLPRTVEPIVVASGIDLTRAVDEFRVRRDECQEAAKLLGVARLGDLGERDLSRAGRLPEPLGRRVRHVVREDARVRDAVEALRRGDADYLGALFDASHASQRDDFQVSKPQIDVLVALSRAQPEVLGARLSGWGFGGSIVALAKVGTAFQVAHRIADRFTRLSGLVASVVIPSGPATAPF